MLTDLAQGTTSIPVVLVGNKGDLRPDQREVKLPDPIRVQKSIGCPWIETSARANENVLKAFEMLIGEIEKARNPGKAPAKSNCILM